MKKLFISALALVMLAGCKDVDPAGNSADKTSGVAYMSLSLLSGNAKVRANTSGTGTEAESKANTVTVLLFNDQNICLGAVSSSGGTIGNSDGAGNVATAGDALEVPADTKRVFVVVNNVAPSWDLTPATVKNKTWATINSTLATTAPAISTANSFMMTSAGSLLTGALTDVTVVKPASKNQADIDAAKLSAKGTPIEINIDRLAAKIDLNVSGSVALPTDATFSLLGWDLSVTNKTVRLYSDMVKYNNNTTTAINGVYRQDGNYTVAEQPVGSVGLKKAFNYLTNDPLSDVALANGATAYCLENTMDAAAQKLGVTTKVVVKAKFTPAGITDGTSYFIWLGNTYTLATLKTAYASHASGTGLKVDLPAFLTKAGIYTSADGDIDTFVTNLTDAQFTATSGITGRFESVRYYHESVCYYDVLIFHDQNVTGDMELGRYGVVRNNWYSLQINRVNSPGTPWIPDPSDPDPSNPTDPDTDDDKGNAYLSVKITINPWTHWNQGVILG